MAQQPPNPVAPLIPKVLMQMGMQAVNNNNAAAAASSRLSTGNTGIDSPSDRKAANGGGDHSPKPQEESVAVTPESLFTLITGKRYFKDSFDEPDRAAKFLTGGKLDTKDFVHKKDLQAKLSEQFRELAAEKIPHLDPGSPGLEWIWQRMTPDEFQQLDQRAAGNDERFRILTVEKGLDFFISDLRKKYGDRIAIVSPVM